MDRVDSSEAARLHELLMDVVRAAGLLQPDQTAAGHPVSLSQAFALHELDTGTPLSQRDLAERLRLEKSSVSRLAAEMERKGLLVRERDPQRPSAVPAPSHRTGTCHPRTDGNHLSRAVRVLGSGDDSWRTGRAAQGPAGIGPGDPSARPLNRAALATLLAPKWDAGPSNAGARICHECDRRHRGSGRRCHRAGG